MCRDNTRLDYGTATLSYKYNLVGLVVLQKCAVLFVIRFFMGPHLKQIYRAWRFENRSDEACADREVHVEALTQLLPRHSATAFVTPLIFTHIYMQLENQRIRHNPFPHTNTRLFTVRYTRVQKLQIWNGSH